MLSQTLLLKRTYIPHPPWSFFFFFFGMVADMELVIYGMMGICMKFLDLWDVKIEKKYTPKKNNHTQNRIYVIRQFAYIHEVTGISLFSRKNTKCSRTIFFSLKKHQTLISKITVFISCAQDLQWATKKGSKNFLYSMDWASKNLPLKNVTILFWINS